MSRLREQVTEFHHAMDCPTRSRPQFIPAERAKLRVMLVAEEFFEMVFAVCPGMFESDSVKEVVEYFRAELNENEIKVDLPALADALADLDYVVEGTRLEFGIDGDPIADEVHRSNMGKITANGQVVMRGDGKIMKPETWSPPDIEGELRRQGWEG